MRHDKIGASRSRTRKYDCAGGASISRDKINSKNNVFRKMKRESNIKSHDLGRVQTM